MNEKCCGTCEHHTRDADTRDWVCGNEDCENYGFETSYKDVCDDWERRLK